MGRRIGHLRAKCPSWHKTMNHNQSGFKLDQDHGRLHLSKIGDIRIRIGPVRIRAEARNLDFIAFHRSETPDLFGQVRNGDRQQWCMGCAWASRVSRITAGCRDAACTLIVSKHRMLVSSTTGEQPEVNSHAPGIYFSILSLISLKLQRRPRLMPGHLDASESQASLLSSISAQKG